MTDTDQSKQKAALFSILDTSENLPAAHNIEIKHNIVMFIMGIISF